MALYGIWDLRGTAQQNQWCIDALTRCDFPFNNCLPYMSTDNKTHIPVEFANLTGVSMARLGYGSGDHEHNPDEPDNFYSPWDIERIENGTVGPDFIPAVLGQFYLPPNPRIVIERTLDQNNTKYIFMAEAAHFVDFYWMKPETKRHFYWNRINSHASYQTSGSVPDYSIVNGHGCAWLAGDYGFQVGEAWMNAFCSAYAEGGYGAGETYAIEPSFYIPINNTWSSHGTPVTGSGGTTNLNALREQITPGVGAMTDLYTPPPPPPGPVVSSAVSSTDGRSATISWTGNPTAFGFIMYLRYQGQEFGIIRQINNVTSPYLLTGIDPGTSYEVAVLGEGDVESNWLPFTTIQPTPLSSFTDDFGQPAGWPGFGNSYKGPLTGLDTGKWFFDPGIDQDQAGTLRITPAAQYPTARSISSYDATGVGAIVQLIEQPGGFASESLMSVHDFNYPSDGIIILRKQSGNRFLMTNQNPVFTTNTDPWWRIKEETNGSIVCQTSQDGITWTTRTPEWPKPAWWGGVGVLLSGGIAGNASPATGYTRFDNFNLPPSPVPKVTHQGVASFVSQSALTVAAKKTTQSTLALQARSILTPSSDTVGFQAGAANFTALSVFRGSGTVVVGGGTRTVLGTASFYSFSILRGNAFVVINPSPDPGGPPPVIGNKGYVISLPASKFVDAINASVTEVTNRVEFYLADNVTLWKTSTELGLISGEVTVDSSRDERRGFSIVLDNTDNDLSIGADYLWYDKVVKIYRGVVHDDGTTYERKLGEFLIDSISQKHFPNDIILSGRDFSKKLLHDKFAITTGFARNEPVEEIVRAIAINGGIAANKINFPLTGKSTGREYIFDREVSRWEAIKQIANDAALDVFFDQEGELRLIIFADPYLDEPQYTFQTGEYSNLIEFEKQVTDSMIYNHVVVTGGSLSQDAIPPYAVATNNNFNSPTSVGNLGQRRSYFYESSHITTEAQCLEVAEKFLKTYALEQFSVDLTSLVVPNLEAGITVHFFDPNPNPGQPDKYLLTGFTIPVGLGNMSANVKRVTSVG